MLHPRLSTVMRYARTTRFNWPDMWHCGVRRELRCPSSYVPTTRFLKRPAWKESRFWIRPRDPKLESRGGVGGKHKHLFHAGTSTDWEPQPRVSELLNGKIANKSVGKLLSYAGRLSRHRDKGQIRAHARRALSSWRPKGRRAG